MLFYSKQSRFNKYTIHIHIGCAMVDHLRDGRRVVYEHLNQHRDLPTAIWNVDVSYCNFYSFQSIHIFNYKYGLSFLNSNVWYEKLFTLYISLFGVEMFKIKRFHSESYFLIERNVWKQKYNEFIYGKYVYLIDCQRATFVMDWRIYRISAKLQQYLK